MIEQRPRQQVILSAEGAIVQGVIVAGCAVYINQVSKQAKK